MTICLYSSMIFITRPNLHVNWYNLQTNDIEHQIIKYLSQYNVMQVDILEIKSRYFNYQPLMHSVQRFRHQGSGQHTVCLYSEAETIRKSSNTRYTIN